MANFKNTSPFYLDIINVSFLCYGKYMAQMEEIPLLSNFEVCLQLAILFIFLKLVLSFSPPDFSARVF